MRGDRLAAAQAATQAVTIELPRGSWRGAESIAASAGDLGLMVVEGLIARDLVLGRRLGSELVGAGDVLRPDDLDGDAPVPFDVVWTVLADSRVAVLDRRFARAVAPFPELTAELLRRAVSRGDALALRLAIEQIAHLDDRVLLVLWQLADRWGRVGHDGVTIPFRLTHEQLSHLVGARRPSVTTALGHLADNGDISRDVRGRIVLRGEPPSLPRNGSPASARRYRRHFDATVV